MSSKQSSSKISRSNSTSVHSSKRSIFGSSTPNIIPKHGRKSKLSKSKGKKGVSSEPSVVSTYDYDDDERYDPKLLATVTLKEKKGGRPVSRRTKIRQNQLEQEILAKKRRHQKVNYLARRTKFDSEQVRALLDIFKRLSSMGNMDRLRFRETLHNTFGLTNDVMLDRIFYSFDGDNEGSVSETEWVIGLSVILRGTLEEQIAFCYQVYDVNGDEAIGRDELHSCLRGCLYPIPGHNNEDNDLDLEEGTREIVELAMKKLDLDHDGVIKYGDFHRAVHNDPLLLQAVGECLPADEALMTFISLFDTDTRKFNTYLSHHSDPSWQREHNKFDPATAANIRKKYRFTHHDTDIKLQSVFKRGSHGILKGLRSARFN